MNEWLETMFFNNPIKDYCISLGVFVLLYIFVKLIRAIVLRRLKRWSEQTSNTLDDFLVKQLERQAIPILYLISLYAALSYLTFPAAVSTYIYSFFIIVFTIYIVRFISALIKYFLSSYWNRHRGSEEAESLRGISGFISVFIWSLGAIFILDNLGFKVSTIVAGLGIGGIAMALAAQTILADLFSYIVIFFDRPFQVGDFLVIDDKVGAVEYIGIKTTRIRSLSGEQLVFSNKDLTNSRVHNFKKMQERRVVFSLGVTYQTPYDKLQSIPGLIKKIIDSHDGVRFDRAHFFKYGDSSLDFEIVYYVIGADYTKYMDIQQSINLKIFEEFEQRKIEFAYPTRTLYLNQQ